MFRKIKESGMLSRCERPVVAMVFALLIAAAVFPAGVFHEKSNEVYGYSVRRSGGVVFHTPTEKVDEEEEEREYTEEEKERIKQLRERIDRLGDLVEDMKKRGELPSTVPVKEGEPYITEYISFGGSNNPEEVRKLQTFLNRHMEAGLSVTGHYDRETMEAVKDFQYKYAEFILEPWGISEPTGFVYLTTQRMINAIEHPDQYFPMPDELVPYSRAVSAAPTTHHPVTPEQPEVEEDERDEEEVEDGEIIIDDDYVWDEDEEDEEEDEEEGANLFVWAVIIVASIGFVVVVYQLRTVSGAPKR